MQLAGEILSTYGQKSVTLVSTGELLAGCGRSVGSAATQWLEKKGARVIINDRVVNADKQSWMTVQPKTFKLSSGEEVVADLCFACFGQTPTGHKFVDKRRSLGLSCIECDEAFRVPHLSTPTAPVFAIGDVCAHDASKLKVAHAAEMNAHTVAHNVIAHAKKEALQSYPHGIAVVGTAPK